MAWDKTQPQTTTKLKLVPSVITPNWDAIEDGTVPHQRVRLTKRVAPLPLDPALVADTVQVYSKLDATSGQTELYSINSAGTVTQLTRGTIPQLVPTASSLGATGRFYYPGGLVMGWTRVTAPVGNNVLAYGTAYSVLYSVQFTMINANNTFNPTTLYIVSPGLASATVRNDTGQPFDLYLLTLGQP